MTGPIVAEKVPQSQSSIRQLDSEISVLERGCPACMVVHYHLQMKMKGIFIYWSS